jgi:hypothetical protein
MSRRIKERLSYGNVVATLAVFVALGGTSYALTLPRNSVGAAQLRTNSVGSGEIRRHAVKSSDLNDRTIRLRDISLTARHALQGQTGPVGPPGPTFFATVDSAGGQVRGNATSFTPAGFAATLIGFSRSVANCVAAATLTSTPGGPNPTPPPNGHVTVEPGSDGRVLVKTWTAAGAAAQYPFNLVVACP